MTKPLSYEEIFQGFLAKRDYDGKRYTEEEIHKKVVEIFNAPQSSPYIPQMDTAPIVNEAIEDLKAYNLIIYIAELEKYAFTDGTTQKDICRFLIINYYKKFKKITQKVFINDFVFIIFNKLDIAIAENSIAKQIATLWKDRPI